MRVDFGQLSEKVGEKLPVDRSHIERDVLRAHSTVEKRLNRVQSHSEFTDRSLRSKNLWAVTALMVLSKRLTLHSGDHVLCLQESISR